MRLADLLHQIIMKGSVTNPVERTRLLRALGNASTTAESIRVFEENASTTISAPEIKFGSAPAPATPIEKKPSFSVGNFDRVAIALRSFMVLEKHERQVFHDMLDMLDLD